MKHFEWKRQGQIEPYDVTTNSSGREHIGRVLMGRFAEFFKDGDKILSVGVHPAWDYSPFFNSPAKQCQYITSDIKEEMSPNIVDNFANTTFEEDSLDGVILIGVYDSLIEATAPEITTSLEKVLKPGGRAFVAITGQPQGNYNPGTAWPNFYIDEVYYSWSKTNRVEPDGNYYGEGDNQAIFLVLRRK